MADDATVKDTTSSPGRMSKRHRHDNPKQEQELSLTPTHYRRIRFIGYPIPTTPANVVACGDPNGQGMVGGSYLGHEDFETDVRARVAVLMAAAATARQELARGEEEEEDVLTVFMAPEFFWHGDEGPYLHAGDEPDPADAILRALEAAFDAAEYRHWLVVAGTCITALVEDKDKLYSLNSTVTRNAVVAGLAEQWRKSYGPLSEGESVK